MSTEQTMECKTSFDKRQVEDEEAEWFPKMPIGARKWIDAQWAGFTTEQFMQQFGIRQTNHAQYLLRKCTQRKPAVLVFIRATGTWRKPLGYEEFVDWVTEGSDLAEPFAANALARHLSVTTCVVVNFLNRMREEGLAHRIAEPAPRNRNKRTPREAWVLSDVEDPQSKHISTAMLRTVLEDDSPATDGPVHEECAPLSALEETTRLVSSPFKRKRSASLDDAHAIHPDFFSQADEPVDLPSRSLPPIGEPFAWPLELAPAQQLLLY